MWTPLSLFFFFTLAMSTSSPAEAAAVTKADLKHKVSECLGALAQLNKSVEQLRAMERSVAACLLRHYPKVKKGNVKDFADLLVFAGGHYIVGSEFAIEHIDPHRHYNESCVVEYLVQLLVNAIPHQDYAVPKHAAQRVSGCFKRPLNAEQLSKVRAVLESQVKEAKKNVKTEIDEFYTDNLQ